MIPRALMDKYLDESIRPDVEELLRMKTEMSEMGEGKRFDRVDAYIDRTVDEIENIIAQLPDKDTQGWETLNNVFLKLI